MSRYTTINQDADGTSTAETNRYARSSGRYVGSSTTKSGVDENGNAYRDMKSYNRRGKVTDSAYTEINKPDELANPGQLAQKPESDKMPAAPSLSATSNQSSVAQPSTLSPMSESLGSYGKLNNNNLLIDSTGSKNTLQDFMSATSKEPFSTSPLSTQMGLYKTDDLMPRKNGGPVRPDQAYMVGENGREAFIPDVPGDIVSNKDIQKSPAVALPTESPYFINLGPSQSMTMTKQPTIDDQGQAAAAVIRQRHAALSQGNPDRRLAERVEVIQGNRITPQYFKPGGNDEPYTNYSKNNNVPSIEQLEKSLKNTNNYEPYLVNPDRNSEAGDRALYSVPNRSLANDFALLEYLTKKRDSSAEQTSNINLHNAQTKKIEAEALKLAQPGEMEGLKKLGFSDATIGKLAGRMYGIPPEDIEKTFPSPKKAVAIPLQSAHTPGNIVIPIQSAFTPPTAFRHIGPVSAASNAVKDLRDWLNYEPARPKF